MHHAYESLTSSDTCFLFLPPKPGLPQRRFNRCLETGEDPQRSLSGEKKKKASGTLSADLEEEAKDSLFLISDEEKEGEKMAKLVKSFRIVRDLKWNLLFDVCLENYFPYLNSSLDLNVFGFIFGHE
ncbi:hypothetical protein CEXT_651321 [Caerostris extrusa]|uniref:Uncharacterized protein n=1 Tax=Caerostris extrusa TaxID=172846 RepID=A0AAV4T6U7_CAEEX|nr:hypothetical protein CEXT_651321 [Caerostris extrusa]